jgi:hypothetical protein
MLTAIPLGRHIHHEGKTTLNCGYQPFAPSLLRDRVLTLELAAGGAAARHTRGGGGFALSKRLNRDTRNGGRSDDAIGGPGVHQGQRGQREQYDKMPHAYLSAVRGRNFRLPFSAYR